MAPTISALFDKRLDDLESSEDEDDDDDDDGEDAEIRATFDCSDLIIAVFSDD